MRLILFPIHTKTLSSISILFNILKRNTSSLTQELLQLLREQIFACEKSTFAFKGYSENHDILSKSHELDLDLQTLFYFHY